jgi:Flp pilus assembly protein TadD
MSTLSRSHGSKHAAVIAAIAALIAVSTTALAGDRYELRAHDADVYGKYALLDGNIDVSIERLEKRLAGARAHSFRAPLLINLCAAYTMKRDFVKAEERCDAAIENGWNAKMAYNNRGIMHVARGDYLAAVDDFEAAAGGRESGLYGKHLLQARNRVEQGDGDTRLARAAGIGPAAVGMAAE